MESVREALSQEYRTKKKPDLPKEEPERYEWEDKLDPTMDDIREKFAREEEFNDQKAGGTFEINNTNPIFYVKGNEMAADSISPFHNDFAVVKCNGQEGFIDKNGELLSGKFFKKCDDFEDGWGLVINNEGKRNYINADAEFLLPYWVSRASTFMNGEAIVVDNGERYKIDTQGNKIE